MPKKSKAFRKAMRLAERAARFKLRQAGWSSLLGSAYVVGNSSALLVQFLKNLDKERKLGNVIVDLGSGPRFMKDVHGHRVKRIFYPVKGKKVVRVDIALPSVAVRGSNVLDIRADIENTAPDSISQKAKFLRVAKHLGVAPRARGEEARVVDSMIFFDVLNYVDYKRTLSGLSRYLKIGGRVIISNYPGYGPKIRFSEKRPKTNEELIDFLKANGFEIEHCTYADLALKHYFSVHDLVHGLQILLVARKKK